MRWKDSRLLFSNLYREGENRVPVKTIQKLWLPLNNVIHSNAIIGEIHKDSTTKVVIQAQTNPLPLRALMHREEFLQERIKYYAEVKNTKVENILMGIKNSKWNTKPGSKSMDHTNGTQPGKQKNT